MFSLKVVDTFMNNLFGSQANINVNFRIQNKAHGGLITKVHVLFRNGMKLGYTVDNDWSAKYFSKCGALKEKQANKREKIMKILS